MKSYFSNKGSVLVFALIVLAFSLISALSVAVISTTEMRSSFATEKSSRSFQVADSGAEVVLQKIYKGNFADLNALAAAAGNTCSNGVITGSILSDGTYKVFLYDYLDVQLNDCSDGSWRSKVARLKSEGASSNTIRAVEVAIAAQ